jgi:hypothetical protein
MTSDELLEQVTDLFVRRVAFLLFLLHTLIFQISSGTTTYTQKKNNALTRLVPGFLPRWPGFDSKSSYVGLVVDTAAMG